MITIFTNGIINDKYMFRLVFHRLYSLAADHYSCSYCLNLIFVFVEMRQGQEDVQAVYSMKIS